MWLTRRVLLRTLLSARNFIQDTFSEMNYLVLHELWFLFQIQAVEKLNCTIQIALTNKAVLINFTLKLYALK